MPVERRANGEVTYFWPFGDETGAQAAEPVNAALGHTVTVRFTGERYCVRCGRPTTKTFGEGFCYPCFRDAPEAGECIVRPELCRAHLGGGRDPQWEQDNHNQPHAVYLAVTSAVKVGVTRETQIPVRWIDQGAAAAVQIVRTPYRQLAGEIEVALKTAFTDKTNWQRMLKNETLDTVDLSAEMEKVRETLPDQFHQYLLPDSLLVLTTMKYPVSRYPLKVKSVNLEKEGSITGILSGVRGQYLMFDEERVVNVRRHSGLVIAISW